MKNSLILAASLAIFIAGCGSKIDDKTVKKYEERVNASIVGEGVSIEPFRCEASGEDLVCTSPGGVLDGDLMRAGKIVLTTNEVYLGEPAKISLNEYYGALFKQNGSLRSTLFISDIELGDSESLASEAAGISPELGELAGRILAQKIGFKLDIKASKQNDRISYDTATSITAGSELDIRLDMLSSLKDEVFAGYHIDTETLALDGGEDLLLDPSVVLDVAQISSVGLNASLNTKGALDPFIDIAKGSLGVMKGGASADEIELFDSAIEVLNSIGKEPVFRLNISASLKEQSLKDAVAIGASSVEKLVINGKDVTGLVGMINDFMD